MFMGHYARQGGNHLHKEKHLKGRKLLTNKAKTHESGTALKNGKRRPKTYRNG